MIADVAVTAGIVLAGAQLPDNYSSGNIYGPRRLRTKMYTPVMYRIPSPPPPKDPEVGHANEEGYYSGRVLHGHTSLKSHSARGTPGVLLSDDMPVNNSPGA